MDWVFYRDHPGVPLVMRLLDDDNDPEDVLQLLMRFDDFPPVPAANPDSLRFGDNRRQRPPGFKKPRRK
ncbi:MAG: hypothetical protein KDA52_08100 [Planctomycetaceae bacterium]|nr:hypothetical protein [Planctomycetaceae bacterium]